MNIESKRKLLAEKAGLFLNYTKKKYNQPDEEIPQGRFYCRVEDWKPDQDLNQLAYVINKVSKENIVDIKNLFNLTVEECQKNK